MKLQTQLNFGGNCEEAFHFYEALLGGKITAMMRQSELPAGYNTPPEMMMNIVHARLSAGDAELIGNDVPAQYFQPIRSSYVYLATDSTEEADRVWSGLIAGGEATMPIAETFFATRFGVLWSIIHPKPMPA